MANKKCPKCGEDNPAEAVMCWACYTPLSGAAPLTAGAAALPATAGAVGGVGAPGVTIEDEKKGTDPKVIGVAAVLLIGAVIAGVVMFGGGGSPPADTGTTTGVSDPPPAAIPGAAPPVAGGPSLTVPMPSGGGAPVAAQPAPFQTVVQPNPKFATGTVGILANQPNIDPRKALGLAKAARQQFIARGGWKNMQVAVFSSPDSAKAFQQYQSGRQSAPLTGADYQALAGQGVWTGTPAFYESKGGSESFSYPSSNPTGWWSSRR